MKREGGGQCTTRPEKDSLFLRTEEDWNFNSRQRKRKKPCKGYQHFSKGDLNCYESIL